MDLYAELLNLAAKAQDLLDSKRPGSKCEIRQHQMGFDVVFTDTNGKGDTYCIFPDRTFMRVFYV